MGEVRKELSVDPFRRMAGLGWSRGLKQVRGVGEEATRVFSRQEPVEHVCLLVRVVWGTGRGL